MKNYIHIDNINFCLDIDKKEGKKNIKTEFVKKINVECFNFLKNPIIGGNIKNTKINYQLIGEKGMFIVYDDIPFHSHLSVKLQEDKDIEDLSKIISSISELCDEINNKITKIEFSMILNFALTRDIKIEKIFNNEKINKLKETNKVNNLKISGLEFILDYKDVIYDIDISKIDNMVEVGIRGTFISRKEKGEKRFKDIYFLVKNKVEKIINDIDSLV